jgi:hypothetical protein
MEDDVDAVVSKLDWSPSDNGYLGNIFGSDHDIENCCAYQAGGARQDEMHVADRAGFAGQGSKKASVVDSVTCHKEVGGKRAKFYKSRRELGSHEVLEG